MEDKQLNSLSLYEQTTPVNKDINIIYTPDSSIMKYEYRISKDDVFDNYIEVNNNQPTTIFLNDTGIYKIEIKTFDYYNKPEVITSGVYNIDKDKPIIKIDDSFIDMEKGSTLDVMGGIKAYDKQDGDLIDKVTTNYDQLDFTTTGLKKLTYTVSDEAGNTTTSVVNINVTPNYSYSLFIIQTLIIIILLFMMGIVAFYRRSMKLERRLSKYTIAPIKDTSLSLFDNVLKIYQQLVKSISKVLVKSELIKKYSLRYEKYINTIYDIYSTGLELVSSKLIISFSFLLVAIFSKTIQYEILNGYEIVIPLLVGFFVPDILYAYKYRLYRNKIENDLLQAIIIMNNAFKSGRSITQAIELVTTELEGPIAEEFKKMHLEVTFGLGINIVFKRFSNRIQLEEVAYLTASLSILNKTGGNIIKVFSSIEKSLFNKKKLKLELQSLTGSSKIIVYVLLAIPILFVLLISIINPTYFIPLYTTTTGFILLGVMILIYITYFFVVRRIMKVRM